MRSHGVYQSNPNPTYSLPRHYNLNETTISAHPSQKMSFVGLVLGATGLTGSFLLNSSLESGAFSEVTTIARRPLPFQTDARQLLDADTDGWKDLVPSNITHLVTALAAARSVGGPKHQYKIDHDLNLDLATAAKAKGCKTIVVVSAIYADVSSSFDYCRMKGLVEKDIMALDFDHTIILRPGVIIGKREANQRGTGNSLAEALGRLVHRTRFQSLALYPVYGEEISKVALHLATKPDAKKLEIIESSDILKIAQQLSGKK